MPAAQVLPWNTLAPLTIKHSFPALVFSNHFGYALGRWYPDRTLEVNLGDQKVKVLNDQPTSRRWLQLAPRLKTDGSTPHPRPVVWVVGQPKTNKNWALCRGSYIQGIRSSEHLGDYYYWIVGPTSLPMCALCTWNPGSPPAAIAELSPESIVHFLLV